MSSSLIITGHMPRQVSDKCYALVLSMLALDPAMRPSLGQIAAHQWVRAGMPQDLLHLNDDLLSEACSSPAQEYHVYLSCVPLQNCLRLMVRTAALPQAISAKDMQDCVQAAPMTCCYDGTATDLRPLPANGTIQVRAPGRCAPGWDGTVPCPSSRQGFAAVLARQPRSTFGIDPFAPHN